MTEHKAIDGVSPSLQGMLHEMPCPEGSEGSRLVPFGAMDDSFIFLVGIHVCDEG